ncbi:MAG TPA: cytochrome c [Caulobacteraceae bacterium]
MLRNRRRAVLGRALAAMAGAVALTAGATGLDALKDRQAHMKGLGAAAKALGEQFHSGAPDKAVVKLQADRIFVAAKAMDAWFPRGSGVEAGAKTRALPAIWTDPAGFVEAQKRLFVAAEALDAAADSGDMAAVGAQMRPVGEACKGCHDKFREPDKS